MLHAASLVSLFAHIRLAAQGGLEIVASDAEVLTRAVVVATELPLQLPLELSSRAMIEPGLAKAQQGPCSPWHAAHLAIGVTDVCAYSVSGRLPRGITPQCKGCPSLPTACLSVQAG